MMAPRAMRSNHRPTRLRRPLTAAGYIFGRVTEGVCPSCGATVPSEARFCPSCGTAVEGGTGRSPEAPATELRPATALFADVVGSTSLGERLSPDEVKALIGECVSRMSQAVEDFGGTIQAYMGDGIAAYFGLPRAHEDDPERGARAALRILEVVKEYSADIAEAWGITDFDVRVGVNTGQVGVGMVGGANPQEVGLGDATNVAARLQSAAAPGTIAVGESTTRLLAHRFALEPLGELSLKGREEPVAAWRLVGPRTGDQAEPRAPVAGRDAEVARLRGLLDELMAGRGQILELVGEVGIGKTRLLSELRALAGDRVTWLEGRCPSYGGELLFWPFVEMLREWLGVADGAAEVAVRTRLRARLSAVLGERVDDVLPYLGRLLSVRLDREAEDRVREMSAEGAADGIRVAYAALIEALAAEGPVVVAMEDLHWADPSTRHLAEELLPLTDRVPVLMATTLRADPASEGWGFRLRVMAEYAHRAVELNLGPLDPTAAEALADALVPGGIDPRTRQALVERAEGNPLYLEELLRDLIESGALERKRTWTLSVSAQDLVPPALESLLVARIDRLPASARRLIQIISVMGRTFPARLVEEVAGAAGLQEDLAVLLRADLIREHRRYPEMEYTFRHGLLQDAALSTLSADRRRELSGRVAQAAESLYADSMEEHLDRMAHYFGSSRDLPKALHYLERAGDKAASLDSREQAVVLWRHAQKVAARLGDAEAEDRLSRRLAAAEAEASST
jgi:class 3 adenylate cyclase